MLKNSTWSCRRSKASGGAASSRNVTSSSRGVCSAYFERLATVWCEWGERVEGKRRTGRRRRRPRSHNTPTRPSLAVYSTSERASAPIPKRPPLSTDRKPSHRLFVASTTRRRSTNERDSHSDARLGTLERNVRSPESWAKPSRNRKQAAPTVAATRAGKGRHTLLYTCSASQRTRQRLKRA